MLTCLKNNDNIWVKYISNDKEKEVKMKKILKNKTELFNYLMHGYIYELEDVLTKNGLQKRLKDNELEQELKNKTKEEINIKDLFVELKLGPSYNRTENVWIQLYTPENKSGTRGRYVGISFERETNEISIWIGFGKTAKRRAEIFELVKEYKMKYSLIEPNLKYGFEYKSDYYDAIIIEKKVNMRDFNNEEFERDLEYITSLYKSYEVRFENAIISLSGNEDIKLLGTQGATYEELNERMLTLIEEVGNLAKAIKELKK